MLVRQAVQLMLSIQSSFSRSTGRQLSSNAIRRLTSTQLEAAFPDPTTRYGTLIQLKLWLTLQDHIAELERWVRQDLARPDLLKRLQSVPGIGPILGMTILLETGAIERFASVGDYASYCRMVESVRLSNGKRKGHGNRKCGNRYLCWAFVEAANYATRYHPAIRRWYERKRARKHRVVAIKAVGHKLARACYYMLREGTTFDPGRAFQ